MSNKNIILIKNGLLINKGKKTSKDVLIKNGRIEKIDNSISAKGCKVIDAEGLIVMPGVIDDQVHFREPGLTHKANIYTEAKAAVAGGTTSFMEMPNTKPPAVTQTKLEEKYQVGAKTSLANYSFFMGAANDNLEEVLRTDPKTVCGIKAFMGSSKGNMLVDNPVTLEKLFSECPMLIATHCEDENTVRTNLALFKEKYGESMPIKYHPDIRNVEACLISSTLATDLAKKHNARLHILHISTKEELKLFGNKTPLAEKRITSEVCVHHLYFDATQYDKMGTKIKCNPAIKEPSHKKELFKALLDDRLDIIATDHAPHTIEEKASNYFSAPSGLPLVQHSLNVMLDFYHQGKISLEKIVEKMCHAPAICFEIEKRGFLEEGYWADIVLLDPNKEWTVSKRNLKYKCGWSPLEGKRFKGKVNTTIVSGHIAYRNGRFYENKKGERLTFDRD